MPLALVPAPTPDPRAVQHDAMVANISARVRSLGEQIVLATSLHRSDESTRLNEIRRQLDLEMMRLEAASDDAWELAGK